MLRIQTAQNKIKIRKAEKKDLKKIAEIFRIEYAKYPYNEKWGMKGALDKIKEYFKNCSFFIAEIDSKIVGFIIANTYDWYDGIRGLISEIVISKEYQRKGIGKKLMNSIEDYFKKKHVKEMLLYAHTNSKSINFYKKLNYKKEGYIPFIKKLK